MTLVAGRAWYGVGNDGTGIDCPSQCGLIKEAWSQVFLVKLHDASTNIASSVDELRLVRGPTPAYSSLTPQSKAGVPDKASCPLATGALPSCFFILRVLSRFSKWIVKKLAGAHGRGTQVGLRNAALCFAYNPLVRTQLPSHSELGSRNIWSTCLALKKKKGVLMNAQQRVQQASNLTSLS